MHQHPRPSPRSATPATNPTTNPERTNNPREQVPNRPRSRSSVDLGVYTERAGGDATGMASRTEGTASGSQDRENTKLNQIIQHFHTKAALMICSSRANLPQAHGKNGEVRQNRWFNIVLDETDVLIDDLQEWRRPDLYQNRPHPLVIEILLDTAHLSQNQALVIEDENGDRREITNAPADAGPSKNGKTYREVILERWTIGLGDASDYSSAELNELLPNVYKKGIVIFRALYSFLRFLPAWKLFRKLGRQSVKNQGLRMKFRIRQSHAPARGQKDALYTPLCSSGETSTDEIVDHHQFLPLLTPSGPLHITVSYRSNCSIEVADSERFLSQLLSSTDGKSASRAHSGSLPGQRPDTARARYSSTAVGPPSGQGSRRAFEAYGSLGTFHAPEKQRASPVSELRSFALRGEQDPDERDTRRARPEEAFQPASAPISKQQAFKSASPTFRDGSLLSASRQFKPASPSFKDGSLASSPRSQLARPSPSPSPSNSLGRPESALARYASGSVPTSKRTSLNALPQQQLRTPPIPNEIAVASPASSSSPKQPKYTSSFGDRRRRLTTQSGKTAESNTSSGRGSSDSKEKISQVQETGTPGSSGSGRTDEDDITDFIKDLGKAKDIRFHTPPSNARDGSGNVVNLSKYSSYRDGSTQLAEEMSSSSLIQASSGTPPSRRLSNVPGLSTSSSPSRALTHHAPHVRSRLSTHSIVEERAGESGGASGEEGSAESPRTTQRDEEDDDDLPFIFPHDNDQTF